MQLVQQVHRAQLGRALQAQLVLPVLAVPLGRPVSKVSRVLLGWPALPDLSALPVLAQRVSRALLASRAVQAPSDSPGPLEQPVLSVLAALPDPWGPPEYRVQLVQ